MIKIYTFDYSFGDVSVTFEVDTELFTDDVANATLEFYDWNYDETNNPVDEVLKKYAIEVIKTSLCNNNKHSIIDEFKTKEGFANIDGSAGIKLISVYCYTIDEEDLDVNITIK